MKRQHEIDRISVQIVLKALESGIALRDNPIYEEMLEEYPHYQVKREKREKQMKSLNSFLTKFERGDMKDATVRNQFKYQFE